MGFPFFSVELLNVRSPGLGQEVDWRIIGAQCQGLISEDNHCASLLYVHILSTHLSGVSLRVGVALS